MDHAAAWARQHHVALLAGEFGATAQLNPAARLAWIRTVRDGLEARRHRLGALGLRRRHGFRHPAAAGPPPAAGPGRGCRRLACHHGCKDAKPRPGRLVRSARARTPHDRRHVRSPANPARRPGLAPDAGRRAAELRQPIAARARPPPRRSTPTSGALCSPMPPATCIPRFMGWVHGGGNPVGMLAELLAAGLNANLGGRDHAPIEVERQVIAWAAEMLGFPAGCLGRAGHRHLDRQPDRRAGGAVRQRWARRFAAAASVAAAWSPTPRPRRMAACRGRWTWPASAATRCG